MNFGLGLTTSALEGYNGCALQAGTLPTLVEPVECLEIALIGGDTRPPPYRAFSARHDVYGFL